MCLLPAIALLAGCAGSAESARVSQRFATMFHCQSPGVQQTSRSSYVAEGCGTVAHFSCFESEDASDRLVEPGSIAALIGAIADGARGRDTCILEHVERNARQSAPVIVQPKGSEAGRLVSRLLLRDGHLVALGKPALHPAHALLFVHTNLRRLQPAPCQAELFHDGRSIPIERIERTGDHEARMLIPVDSLADMDQAVRVAGTVCGAEFELDDSGRKALGLFHARFGEERERAAQKLASGGERALNSGPEDASPSSTAPP